MLERLADDGFTPRGIAGTCTDAHLHNGCNVVAIMWHNIWARSRYIRPHRSLTLKALTTTTQWRERLTAELITEAVSAKCILLLPVPVEPWRLLIIFTSDEIRVHRKIPNSKFKLSEKLDSEKSFWSCLMQISNQSELGLFQIWVRLIFKPLQKRDWKLFSDWFGLIRLIRNEFLS